MALPACDHHLGWLGQPVLDPARHDLGQADEKQADHQVKAQMKDHHHGRSVVQNRTDLVQPPARQGRGDHDAQQLEYQVA